MKYDVHSVGYASCLFAKESKKVRMMNTRIAAALLSCTLLLATEGAANAADSSPHVREHAQRLLMQAQAHSSARIDVTASVAALPLAYEGELRAYLAESGAVVATGPTARADASYRAAIARRLGGSLLGRQTMIAHSAPRYLPR
jgi:hypothetical protein